MPFTLATKEETANGVSNAKAATPRGVREAIRKVGEHDPEHATDSGTDAFVSATNTTPPGDGVRITRDFQSANTTTTPTLDGKTMTTRDGSALWAGAVFGPHELQYASGTDTYLVLDPVDNINPSTGPEQIAQAWVNFNGTGTVAIRDHYNVSSITDNGTGDYTINFTTNLADTNYAAVGSANEESALFPNAGRTTSSLRILVRDETEALADAAYVGVVILGGN